MHPGDPALGIPPHFDAWPGECLAELEAAKAKARELAGLPEDAKVVPYERKRSVFDLFSLLGSSSHGGSLAGNFLAPSTALEVLARSMLLRDLGVGVR